MECVHMLNLEYQMEAVDYELQNPYSRIALERQRARGGRNSNDLGRRFEAERNFPSPSAPA